MKVLFSFLIACKYRLLDFNRNNFCGIKIFKSYNYFLKIQKLFYFLSISEINYQNGYFFIK